MRTLVACLLMLGLFSSARRPEDRVDPGEQTQSDLFKSDEVVRLTIKGNISDLMKDRGTEPQYHPMTLSYRGADSAEVTLAIQVKTRGHFRKDKSNCSLPPLLLNFSKDEATANSIFHDQVKMKLVTPCRDDRYVVREYLVYKLYNILTPKSFQARLVTVQLEDPERKKSDERFYGILLEEEWQMAKRNETTPLEGKLVRPEQTRREDFLRMAVFEYLIGNTDWSVQYLQNVKLLAGTGVELPATVPYDFDHAGIVGAPYAQPRPELLLSSTRERRYRGYCLSNIAQFSEVIAQYNGAKTEMYGVYSNCNLLDKNYLKATLRYLDAFYQTINDPKAMRRDFLYPCEEGNTGNIVIKPLD